MSSPLRYGILGTGNIARQFAQGVAESSRSVLAAVASRNETRALAFASTHDIPVAYGTYDGLLADDSVDAVYVSLPNTLHETWTVLALQAGKHVLCEKPMATDAAGAERMFDAAEHAGRVLMEAFMYRCHPLTFAVKHHVDTGDIGHLRQIRANFNYATNTVEGNVRFDPDLAGGSIMDIGCYGVSLARHLTAEEPSVVQTVGNLHDTGVDVNAAAVLKFPSGVLATITCGMDLQTNNLAVISGTAGYLEVPIPWKPPRPHAAYSLVRQTPPKMDRPAAAAPPPRQDFTLETDLPLYGIEADTFSRIVQDGAPLTVSRQDTVGNMRVLDQMRQQVAKGT